MGLRFLLRSGHVGRWRAVGMRCSFAVGCVWLLGCLVLLRNAMSNCTVPPELQERVAIIMEACGYTEEHALELAMPKQPEQIRSTSDVQDQEQRC